MDTDDNLGRLHRLILAVSLRLRYQLQTRTLAASIKVFSDFNRALLDDRDFKEDSLREVIITPILTRLGYTPSGSDRVIRSKSLVHPFIYVGTRKSPVTLIPDYTLFSDGKVLCVLDAKSPTEDILSQEHVQQAYSYAIHPEVKSTVFALCNGKQLVVFSVDDANPLLVVDFEDYEPRWAEIEKYLTPRHLKNPALRKFAPDLGSAFLRLGFAKGVKVVMLGVQLNLFARVNDELMAASSISMFADREHCTSFDFHPRLLNEILSGLPSQLATMLSEALRRAPFKAAAELVIELDLEMTLGDEIDNGYERFVLLVIEKVLSSRFNPMPTAAEMTDLPADIFRLRKTYVIVEND